MYAVVIWFGERFYSNSCSNMVDCIRFIAEVIFKEENGSPSKIYIDKEEVL